MDPDVIKQKLNKIFPQYIHLLKHQYRKIHETSKCPASLGFCYIAAEAAYYLTDYDDGMCWRSKVARIGVNETHWWLEGNGGVILDPTDGQFLELGITPPYEFGRFCGFLTSKPSKRAVQLIEAVIEND